MRRRLTSLRPPRIKTERLDRRRPGCRSFRSLCSCCAASLRRPGTRDAACAAGERISARPRILPGVARRQLRAADRIRRRLQDRARVQRRQLSGPDRVLRPPSVHRGVRLSPLDQVQHDAGAGGQSSLPAQLVRRPAADAGARATRRPAVDAIFAPQGVRAEQDPVSRLGRHRGVLLERPRQGGDADIAHQRGEESKATSASTAAHRCASSRRWPETTSSWRASP